MYVQLPVKYLFTSTLFKHTCVASVDLVAKKNIPKYIYVNEKSLLYLYNYMYCNCTIIKKLLAVAALEPKK